MEAVIDDVWERNDGRNVVTVRIIDRARDENDAWHVRVSQIGPVNQRWWLREQSLFARYRQVVGSESAAT